MVKLKYDLLFINDLRATDNNATGSKYFSREFVSLQLGVPLPQDVLAFLETFVKFLASVCLLTLSSSIS